MSTPFHSKYYACELTRRWASDNAEKLSRSLNNATIDLNPHQIDAVVRYTLAKDQRKTIFASRYKLHLPSEAELRAELRREVKALSGPEKGQTLSGLLNTDDP